MCFVGPTMLHGSEAWYQNESEMGNFSYNRMIHGERNVWSIAQRLKKIKGFHVDVGI